MACHSVLHTTFHSLQCKYIGSIWSINSVVHIIQFLESVFFIVNIKKNILIQCIEFRLRLLN